MVMVLLSVGRAHRGLRGDHLTASGPRLHRRAQRQRPERSGGRRAAAILLRDAKLGDQSPHAGYRVGCQSQRRKIAADRRCGYRTVCRPIALLKAAGVVPFRQGGSPRTDVIDRSESEPRSHLPDPGGRSVKLRKRGTSSGASWKRKALRR